MATASRPRAKALDPEPRLYRLTVRQVEQMTRSGVLTEADDVELLGGVLVEPMTKFAPHDFSILQLGALLRILLPSPDWIIREEKAVVLGRYWRPEPDLAVARGPLDRHRHSQPTAKDLPILVEVADSSYTTDRGVKWHGYAAARVPTYWIINLKGRAVEVYTDPAGRGESAKYRRETTYSPGAEIPVVIDGREVGKIAVNDVLP